MDDNRKKRRKTIADLAIHIIIALLLAAFFRWVTGEWTWPLLAIAGGVLIDIDHFVDYFLYYGVKLDLSGFFYHKYRDSGKVYIFLHSWEIVILLLLLSFAFPWTIPVALGMAFHLIVDQLFAFRRTPLFYFLTYRALNRFDVEELIPYSGSDK